MSFTTGIYSAHSQQLLIETEAHRKVNTAKAYDHKVREFKAYCAHVFSGMVTGRETVTEEKIFGFLLYNSRRGMFSNKGKRKGVQAVNFKPAYYDQIMAAAQNVNADELEYQLLGWGQLANYKNAILGLWRQQVDLSSNNVSKDQLESHRVQRLMNEV